MTIKTYNGLLVKAGLPKPTDDLISVEAALRISVNGTPFTVTMRTPGSETELVRGLLWTENVYRSLEPEPVLQILERNTDGIIESIDAQVPETCILSDFAGKRNVISASSCGICGKTELTTDDQIRVPYKGDLQAALVAEMFEQISQNQLNFQQSGGTHASGAFTKTGKLITLQEDIGRHNAVDKVIGHLVSHGQLEEAFCITVSGRISYEIVNKTRSAGIPFLASVSAPSSLAIDMAEAAGISLLSFCRNDKFTIYSNQQQVHT